MIWAIPTEILGRVDLSMRGMSDGAADAKKDFERISANDSLSEMQMRLERQHEDQAAGKDMGIAIRTTNEQIETLTADLRTRRSELEHRKVTSIQTPRVVGVTAVIPGPVPRVMEQGRGGGDNTTVEMAAMEVAMDHESAYGRSPIDVSKTGVEYDVRSEGSDGQVRYIEVKGHSTTGDVVLYYTEWQMAHRMRDEFFIYEVNHALTKPELWITQNPVGKGIEPTERVVEYHVPSGELQRWAASANDLEVYGRRRGGYDFPCPICGCDLLDHTGGGVTFFVQYPNVVCPDCLERAVAADGGTPREWGEEDGDNPVFIVAKKCWRRFRFGTVGMYDPYNCPTLEEFHHRVFPPAEDFEDLEEDE